MAITLNRLEKHEHKWIIPDGDYFESNMINFEEWIILFKNTLLFFYHILYIYYIHTHNYVIPMSKNSRKTLVLYSIYQIYLQFLTFSCMSISKITITKLYMFLLLCSSIFRFLFISSQQFYSTLTTTAHYITPLNTFFILTKALSF